MKVRALIVIDVQKGFDDPFWGERNNPEAESNISTPLNHWRKLSWPIIHIQHASKVQDSPLNPNSAGFEFKIEAMPKKGEPVITKCVNSAFIGTDLANQLRQRGISSVVFVGLTTNHCVSTSCRMAANIGFETVVVRDATAAFARSGISGQQYSAEIIHEVSLANLQGEFATVVTTSALLELTRPSQ